MHSNLEPHARLRVLLSGGLCAIAMGAAASPAAAATCESLSGFVAPNTTITAAQTVAGGTFVPPTGAPITGLPDFCRVALTIAPTPDSNIRVEVWMPLGATWNGRMTGLGGGGYTGTIDYASLGTMLKNGYAATNTDMGTSPATVTNGVPLVGHPEKWLDFGSRSTHLMTVEAKDLIEAFYAKAASRAYFLGCSTGGHQGQEEAQVFPDDYDGIIAGAPGHNRTHLHDAFVYDWTLSHKAPGSVISAAKLAVLHTAVINACRATDSGYATDTFLNNPRTCAFDPAAIQCTSADGPACLTASEVYVARHMYDGLRNPDTGELIYPGWLRGTELGWTSLQGGATAAFPGILNWAFGANYDPLSLDFDAGTTQLDALLAPTVNFMSSDLSRFTAHNGRILYYQGLADPIVVTQDTINYYERLQTEQNLSLAQVQQFARLYLEPGMGHCSGGDGPSTVNGTSVEFGLLPTLVGWVENGVVPGPVIAATAATAPVAMTRPLCVYPAEARYVGAGDATNAANWTCVAQPQADPPNQMEAPRYLAPLVLQARALPDTLNLRTGVGLVTIVLQAPGTDDFTSWVPSNVRAEGAAPVTAALAADARTYVVTFNRADLKSFNGGKDPGNAVDLMLTGDLQHDGVQSLFAASARCACSADDRAGGRRAPSGSAVPGARRASLLARPGRSAVGSTGGRRVAGAARGAPQRAPARGYNVARGKHTTCSAPCRRPRPFAKPRITGRLRHARTAIQHRDDPQPARDAAAPRPVHRPVSRAPRARVRVPRRRRGVDARRAARVPPARRPRLLRHADVGHRDVGAVRPSRGRRRARRAEPRRDVERRTSTSSACSPSRSCSRCRPRRASTWSAGSANASSPTSAAPSTRGCSRNRRNSSRRRRPARCCRASRPTRR